MLRDMFFTLFALFGLVFGHNDVYSVQRQDYGPSGGFAYPPPYQTYSARPAHVYRVGRQEFAAPHKSLPYAYNFNPYAPPPPPQVSRQEFAGPYAHNVGYYAPPQTQFWYPPTKNNYNHESYRPSSIMPADYNVPQLFVPAADQVFDPTPRTPGQSSTDRPNLPTDESGVLPARRAPSADEGEPLSPMSEYSKRVVNNERPRNYVSFNEDVEINAEQKDLLQAGKFAQKDSTEPSSLVDRFRRHAMHIIENPTQIVMERAQYPFPEDMVMNFLNNFPKNQNADSSSPPVETPRESSTEDNFDSRLGQIFENNEVVHNKAEDEVKLILPVSFLNFSFEDHAEEGKPIVVRIDPQTVEKETVAKSTPPPTIACEYRAEKETKPASSEIVQPQVNLIDLKVGPLIQFLSIGIFEDKNEAPRRAEPMVEDSYLGDIVSSSELMRLIYGTNLPPFEQNPYVEQRVVVDEEAQLLDAMKFLTEMELQHKTPNVPLEEIPGVEQQPVPVYTEAQLRDMIRSMSGSELQDKTPNKEDSGAHTIPAAEEQVPDFILGVEKGTMPTTYEQFSTTNAPMTSETETPNKELEQSSTTALPMTTETETKVEEFEQLSTTEFPITTETENLETLIAENEEMPEIKRESGHIWVKLPLVASGTYDEATGILTPDDDVSREHDNVQVWLGIGTDDADTPPDNQTSRTDEPITRTVNITMPKEGEDDEEARINEEISASLANTLRQRRIESFANRLNTLGTTTDEPSVAETISDEHRQAEMFSKEDDDEESRAILDEISKDEVHDEEARTLLDEIIKDEVHDEEERALLEELSRLHKEESRAILEELSKDEVPVTTESVIDIIRGEYGPRAVYHRAIDKERARAMLEQLPLDLDEAVPTIEENVSGDGDLYDE